MNPIDIATVLPSIGIAAPLVVALLYLLKQSNEREERAAQERKEITDKFLAAQQMNSDNTAAMLREFLQALWANTAAIKEMTILGSAEHKDLIKTMEALAHHIDAVGKG